MAKPRYIVIALTGAEIDGKKVGCHIISEDAIYLSIFSKIFGPALYTECVEYVNENCFVSPQSAVKSRTKATFTADELRSSEIRRIDIGSFDGVPETKVEWEGDFIKYPVLYTRRVVYKVYATISAPSDIMGGLWNDIVNCALASAAVGTITAIFGSPASFTPAFKAAFMACMGNKFGDKVDSIEVALGSETWVGEWSRV